MSGFVGRGNPPFEVGAGRVLAGGTRPTNLDAGLRRLDERMLDQRFARIPNCQGFSLLELILVIVVLSIAAVPLMNGFMTMGGWLDTPIESVPRGAQLAQECAEHIVTQRRMDNYAGVATTSCDGLPALPSGYSRTVTVTARTNATLSACPTGTNCKEVAIAVSKGGVTVGRANLMLVEY